MSRMFSSLRAALLIPFVGVVILVAVSISLLSYQTGLKAVDELSEQLLLDISNRVTQATSRHLASSSVVLNAVAPDVAAAGNAPRHSDLVPDSLPQFEQRMWIAANLYPGNEGYIYYGSHKGEFVGLNRKADGDYELRWRELGTAQRTIYATHGPGLRDAVLRTDNYDPRARPWFAEATQRGHGAAARWPGSAGERLVDRYRKHLLRLADPTQLEGAELLQPWPERARARGGR